MPHGAVTTKDVAAPLRLAEKIVHAMAQAGKIPAGEIRGHWRTELDEWIDAQPRGGNGGRDGE